MGDDDLGKRIEAARQAHDVRTGRNQVQSHQGEGMRIGYRMATDFFAAIFVGAGIGWLLDVLLHTKPWMLVIWLGFGFATGVMSIVRISKNAQTTETTTGTPPHEGQEDS